MSHSKLVRSRRKKQRTEKDLAGIAKRAKKLKNTAAAGTKAPAAA